MLEAIFNELTNVVTLTGLTQWDKGRILVIKGLELPDVVEVHFADKINTTAIRMIGTRQDDYIIVEIPDSVIENPHDIHAWVYVTDKNALNKAESKTKKSIYLKVEPRAKPEDFSSENAEDTFSKIIDVVNENVQANEKFKEEITQDNKDFKEAITQDNNNFKTTTNENITQFKTAITDLLKTKQNKILFGTSEPTADLGEDGDVYIQIEG